MSAQTKTLSDNKEKDTAKENYPNQGDIIYL
jgi:hypothetical protein